MDSNKPAQNIQDSFLNTARKERLSITIYLLSGVKLTGRIRSFDKYSVVLEANGQEQLIFKHAISTVVMGRPLPHGAHVTHSDGKAAARDRDGVRIGTHDGFGGECFRYRRIRRFRFAQGTSQKTRARTPLAGRTPLGTLAAPIEDSQERAFLVGLEVRTRARSGARSPRRRRPRAMPPPFSLLRMAKLESRRMPRRSPVRINQAFQNLTRKNLSPN